MINAGTAPKTGMIVGTFGKYCLAADDADPSVIFRCENRGRLKLRNIRPLAGDRVCFASRGGGDGVILDVMDRKNLLPRPPVANADRLVIVASSAPPVTDALLIDSLTALAYYMGLAPLVCINKTDLCPGDELQERYAAAGVPAVGISALTGQGIPELKSRLRDGLSVLTGNSGVGKSSILNRLCPGAGAQTGELSEKVGRGRQITRHVLLHPVATGHIADTPGYSAFDAVEMEMWDARLLPDCFPEFATYAGLCRYSDCAHVRDEGCAILNAVGQGKISPSRHASYVYLHEKIRSAPPDYEARRKAASK